MIKKEQEILKKCLFMENLRLKKDRKKIKSLKDII